MNIWISFVATSVVTEWLNNWLYTVSIGITTTWTDRAERSNTRRLHSQLCIRYRQKTTVSYDPWHLPIHAVAVMVLSNHRPRPIISRSRRVLAGRRWRPVLLAECIDADPDAPAQPGQHQQQAEPDEAHADDLGGRPDTDRVGDGDRHGADEKKPGADCDDDQRTAIVGRGERHRRPDVEPDNRAVSGDGTTIHNFTTTASAAGLHLASSTVDWLSSMSLCRRYSCCNILHTSHVKRTELWSILRGSHTVHTAIGVTTLRQEEAVASSWFLEVVSLSLKLKPSRQFSLSEFT